MTQPKMVQVICPDCRREFDVPDGAAEAQCPQCSETLLWRSCLDTNEVFTVLKKWETWVHPGCDTKHPVDLTHVLSAARPQAPGPQPLQRPTQPPADPNAYSPTQLAADVEWADQEISGRLIVDADRVAIIPAPGVPKPPLSVAWLRDVQGYTVHRAGEGDDKKRKLFGRKKDGNAPVNRPSVVVFAVPGGQIAITCTDQPEVLLASLDQFLRPLLSSAPAAGPVAPAPPTGAPESAPQAVAPAAPQAGPTAPAGRPEAPTAPAPTPPAPAAHAADVGAAPPAAATVEQPAMPDLEPDTPEGVYESIRKLAELAVLGTISSEEFKAKKAQLLARL